MSLNEKTFDLLKTVEQGGCSAKLPAQLLEDILKNIPYLKSENLLVGTENHDDALVWKINDEIAIIQTLDFFPPVCSDPYDFGQIAAANALSDVYAMGGKAITALNIVMFPSAKIDISILKEILKGGADKIIEAGAVLAGGHTIDDYPPKYGLAVTGIIHPDRIITNSKAKAGDVLILTKPLGTGAIIAGHRINEVSETDYRGAIKEMKLLNINAAEIMQKYHIISATDVTGFSLLGHGLKMANASGVSFIIESCNVPVLRGAYDLVKLGCIPGAAFRNLSYIEGQVEFETGLDYNLKMLLLDPQTSGGLLMSCNKDIAKKVIADLIKAGYPNAVVIGRVNDKSEQSIFVRSQI